VLATKYMIEEWEVSSFKILSQRPDPLTVEEAKKLGVVIVTEVFREREKIRSKPDTTDEQTASLPQPVVTAPDHRLCPSGTSQSGATSTSTATTITELVANPTTVTPTSPNNATAKPTFPKVMFPKVVLPGVKLPTAKPGLSEEQKILSLEPHNGHPTNFGSFFAPVFPPSVSGNATQKSGNNSAGVFLGFAESGGSKPSGPTSTISQGQRDTLFSGVGTSDSLFTVKTRKSPKESALPTSTPKFMFTPPQ